MESETQTTSQQPTQKWPRRRNKMPAWAPAFLAVYSKTGNMTHGAREIGLTRESVWSMYKRNAKFAALVDAAREEAIDLLEAHALKRATDKDKPSDILTIFLLKAGRPEKYKDCYRAGTPYEQVQATPQTTTESTVIVLPANGFEKPGTVQENVTVDVETTTTTEQSNGANGTNKQLAEQNGRE